MFGHVFESVRMCVEWGCIHAFIRLCMRAGRMHACVCAYTLHTHTHACSLPKCESSRVLTEYTSLKLHIKT